MENELKNGLKDTVKVTEDFTTSLVKTVRRIAEIGLENDRSIVSLVRELVQKHIELIARVDNMETRMLTLMEMYHTHFEETKH